MNTLTESARYFALCDARKAFAAAMDGTDSDRRSLETLDAMIDEHAAKVRETLKPIRYDVGAMFDNVFGVRA